MAETATLTAAPAGLIGMTPKAAAKVRELLAKQEGPEGLYLRLGVKGGRRWVAVTFDDGPHPEITARILKGLRRAQAPAAFFVIGKRAEKCPDLARRIQAEGHEVGNHTWAHRPLLLGACASPDRQVAR